MRKLQHLSLHQLEVALNYNQMIGCEDSVEEIQEEMHQQRKEQRERTKAIMGRPRCMSCYTFENLEENYKCKSCNSNKNTNTVVVRSR